MGRWLFVVVLAVAGCDRAFGLDRPCDDQFGGDCATCGGIGQSCCAGEITCGEGLYCGEGTCNACVADVALGRRHMCALRYDGTVWCAGQNEVSQIGEPSDDKRRSAELVQVSPLDDIVAIGAGRSHNCAVRADETVWCWGYQSQGRLGNGSSDSGGVPVPVQVIKTNGSPLTGIKTVTAGYCHSCALDGGGHVWCWGCNKDGELGDGTETPRATAGEVRTTGPTSPPFADVAEISVGHEHSCLRTNAGAAWCWGDDSEGQLGDGIRPTGEVPVFETLPVKVKLTGVTSIGAGSQFSCAATLDGGAHCWGRASGDRLGNGEDELPEEAHVPAPVVTSFDGPGFAGVKQISVGSVGCVVTEDTGLWCWGKDVYGTTGGGGGSTVPAPVLNDAGGPLVGAERLIGHYAHTCAKLATGVTVCWGRNTSGELANGTFSHTGRASPVKLTCP